MKEKDPRIFYTDTKKILRSENYNYIFDMVHGVFMRCGKREEDDPDFSKFGPEIADIEVTTICNGPNGTPCPFCYKSNTRDGEYMSFETFKKVFDNLPKMLTQIAFGVDARCESNPDVWKIMEYCRENRVIPNVTVANISDETADKLVKYCGAVAVSRYDDKDICYDTVKKLTDRGMTQVNIHQLISEETYNNAVRTLIDIQSDERLKDMNAVVFLSLKQKGRGKSFRPLTDDHFFTIADFCFNHDVRFGFDSCTAPRFMKYVKEFRSDEFEKISTFVEPCESGLFSSYINVEGKFFPCSFTEGVDEWQEGIDVVDCVDFLKDVWYNKKVMRFRENLLKSIDENNCRNCPVYRI